MAAGTAGLTGKSDVTGQVPDLIAIKAGPPAPRGAPWPASALLRGTFSFRRSARGIETCALSPCLARSPQNHSAGVLIGHHRAAPAD